MNEHSKLPPSSAARRMACPGSRKLEALYPREETEAAKEGTLAHKVCADLIDCFVEPLKYDVSKEMLEHCKKYVEYLAIEHYEHFKTSKLHIEERLDISSVHPECWGTPDAWFVADGTLHMFDFKYGYSPVEVFENWQMIEYAAGVTEPFDHAVFHIVQPRAYHPDGPIRRWEVSRKDLETLWERLRITELLAMSDIAVTTPSIQCVNCAARHACPALQATVLNHIDTAGLNLPENMDENALGNELRILQHAAKLLDARISGLEQEALAKLINGKRIPHYELGEVQSRERWAKDAKDLMALGDLFDVKLQKPIEIEFITPKQAIKAGIPAEVVRNYSETPKGAKKLVAIDEKKVRKIFGGG